jgi:predicted transcriptional regulator
MSRPDAERRRLVAEMRAEGRTLAEIGEVMGVTRQAVSVMLRRIAETVYSHGPNADDASRL